MTVYKPANSPYYYYYFVSGGKKHRGTTKTTRRKAAIEYEKTKRIEVLGVKQLEPIIGVLACDCFKHAMSLWGHTKSYQSFYCKLIESMKHDTQLQVRLSEFNNGYIREWIASLLDRGNARSTVNQKLGILKMCIERECSNNDITLRIAWSTLRLKGATNSHDTYYTEGEENRIYSYMTSHGHEDIAEFLQCLCDIGGRFTSVATLTWRDVDLVNKIITMRHTKNGQTVRVPMTNRVLQVMLKSLSSGNPRPFTTIEYNRVSKVFARMRQSFGITSGTGYKLHAFRHTAGTRLGSAGVDIRTIQHWLGHSDIRQTSKYVQVVPESMLAARDKLEK
jgi:integrase